MFESAKTLHRLNELEREVRVLHEECKRMDRLGHRLKELALACGFTYEYRGGVPAALVLTPVLKKKPASKRTV